MNRFFIRFFGGIIAGVTGIIDYATATTCGATSDVLTAKTAYYVTMGCSDSFIYQANMHHGTFPGVEETGNKYGGHTSMHYVSNTSITRYENGAARCVTAGAWIDKDTFFVPCNENDAPFVVTKFGDSVIGESYYAHRTCSEPVHYESATGSFYGCKINDSGLVTALYPDFFQSYGGCLCASGDAETDPCYTARSGDSTNPDGCNFYYYKIPYVPKTTYALVGCKSGYYQTKETGSGETFSSISEINNLCSPCSGMKYVNGTALTYVPANGETSSGGISWGSSGGVGIESCYANGTMEDDAGTFTFESACKYSK